MEETIKKVPDLSESKCDAKIDVNGLIETGAEDDIAFKNRMANSRDSSETLSRHFSGHLTGCFAEERDLMLNVLGRTETRR